MQNGHAKETGVAIRNIAGRVKGDEIPFIDLAVKDGLMSRIGGWFGA